MIRVMLVDDHEMLLEGLSLALEHQQDIEVLGTATTRRTGFQRFCALEPDVLIVDYRIGDETGADLARDVIKREPSAAVVAMSALATSYILDDIVDAGCLGFVEKRRGIDDLVAAVRAASTGSVHYPRRAMAKRLEPTQTVRQLTSRELEVLERLGHGEHSADIADHLNVSVHTVRNHTREIRRKLGVTTQLAAVISGIRQGLIAPPDPD